MSVCEHGNLARKCEHCEVNRQDKRIDELEAALGAIGEALYNASGYAHGGGSYWPARKFIEERGGYTGDLEGLSVLDHVARLALRERPSPSREGGT